MARRYVSQAERRTEGARYDRAERLLQRAIDDQKRGGSGAAEEGWHVVGDPGEPGLINPWLKWGDPSMRFKKIANLVYVQFYLMQGSPTPAQIFTLPVGYRPTYEVNFIVAW